MAETLMELEQLLDNTLGDTMRFLGMSFTGLRVGLDNPRVPSNSEYSVILECGFITNSSQVVINLGLKISGHSLEPGFELIVENLNKITDSSVLSAHKCRGVIGDRFPPTKAPDVKTFPNIDLIQ
ncbi:hypothetical protein HGM15179_010647 [Zosterops borbonicus]|uniref:Uncharacterized protein n=1 Tax=Zosterops borbonicus TaxID=364589 RepID=A0A8K1GD32_9PASS|nr:hypothetical protein HGM15179_010647 [Zosterops borbonicus]